MLTMFVGILSFFLGRYSYLVDRNKYLKIKEDELMAYRDELIDIAKSLDQKDRHIRKKWQSMVDDFSKYQAAIGNGTDTWTDMDDVYLNSWSSAEK